MAIQVSDWQQLQLTGTQGRVSKLKTNMQWKNKEVCPILGQWGVPLLSHDT